jgi:hypothetical protein
MCGPYGAGACINGRQVYIRGRLVGINRLYDTLEELYKEGKRPGDITGAELLESVSYCNYVPDGLEKEYMEVLIREFDSFYKSQVE